MHTEDCIVAVAVQKAVNNLSNGGMIVNGLVQAIRQLLRKDKFLDLLIVLFLLMCEVENSLQCAGLGTTHEHCWNLQAGLSPAISVARDSKFDHLAQPL